MRRYSADGLEVEIYDDSNGMIEAAAARLFEQARSKTDSILGLATGSTFLPFYGYVAAHYSVEGVSFRKVTTFNLDEYYPIKATSPDSYHTYMNRNLFSRVDLNPANTHLPDGEAPDAAVEAVAYERLIQESGGIDLQFLGLGRNGHIGFNEPGTAPDSRTHQTALSESTIAANSALFVDPGKMPRHALTMGIGTIMEARSLVLLASGKSKAEAVAASLKGEVSAQVPASFLRRHGRAVFMLDREAAAGIA